jgi:thioesterase domain-containing protein/acyl carrier protein
LAIAPRDELERRLARAFAEVLGRSAVGIHDDFFDAGGDSLAALRLGILIERESGHELPLATLFAQPTVARLADAIRGRSAAPPVPGGDLVTIKEGRAARPLFLVPGGRGGKPELMICAKLVSRLGPGETVFGLLAPARSQAVAEIAMDHIASIRRVQPRGPYRIGGECIGGVVAYEIAQQLRSRGEAIELLLLLDTWCPTAVARFPPKPSDRLRAVVKLLGRSPALLKAGMSFLAELPKRDRDAEPWPLEAWRRLTVPRETKRYMQTCLRYRPVPYPGRVTILASQESLRQGLADAWQALAAGGAAVHQAPGDHDSYSRKYFQQTAEQLRLCLEAPGEGRAGHGFTDRC